MFFRVIEKPAYTDTDIVPEEFFIILIFKKIFMRIDKDKSSSTFANLFKRPEAGVLVATVVLFAFFSIGSDIFLSPPVLSNIFIAKEGTIGNIIIKLENHINDHDTRKVVLTEVYNVLDNYSVLIIIQYKMYEKIIWI